MAAELSLDSGISLLFDFLVLVFAIESSIFVLVNPERHFQTVGNDREDQIVSDRAETFRGRAATFAGFAIAIATFLLSSDLSAEQIEAPIQMVWLALGFLLVSYQLKSLTRTDRLWYLLQERTFEYGFLSLVGAIFFLTKVYSIAPTPYLELGVIAVFLIRFRAAFLQLRGLNQMWGRSEQNSRAGYLVDLLRTRYRQLRGKQA